MSWRGVEGGDRSIDDVDDDYDDYDPTPYDGGYDISLTFVPSDDICYLISSSSTVDYNRAQYSSDSTASDYCADTDSGDHRYGRPRPEPEPQCAYDSGGDGGGYGMSEEYGYGERPSSYERPSYEEEGSTYENPSYYVQGQGEGYPIYKSGDETEEERRHGRREHHRRGNGITTTSEPFTVKFLPVGVV